MIPRSAIGLALILLTFAPALSERTVDPPPEVKEAVEAFIPDQFAVDDGLEFTSTARSEDVLTSRAQYQLRVRAETREGDLWSFSIAVDAERLYVTMYIASPLDSTTRSRLVERDFVLSRDETEGIAWRFISARFPQRDGYLQLTSAREPLPATAGGLPGYQFWWRGYIEDAETGDWAQVRVSPNTGDILSYMGRPAVDYREEDVTVSEEQALASVRALIEDTAAVEMDEVEFSVTLMLSHPQATGEGPAWRVVAIRPPIGGDRWDRRLVRDVDARTGELIPAPPAMQSLDRRFFRNDAQ
ncbi:MAG: hypothetical protein ACOX9R_05465 [Armatimonadota bacterium]